MLFPRPEDSGSEARQVERPPEAIPRSREVKTSGTGVKPGIDPAEQNLEIRRDDIRDGTTRGGRNLGRGGPLELR
jgi:hypothetical protein